jgi:archaellum component FlaG (FlaF/FlaG flagellin family)
MFLKISFLAAALYCTICSFAQTGIEEKKPQITDGIEYGYYIKNEQTKNVKDEEYGRFEITLYVTNKTGCSKIYAERVSVLSSESMNLLASFNCTNANGKRLTAKSGAVKAREFYLNAKVQENGKEVTKAVKAGYIFRNGETLKTNMIVLVPKGERPMIQCTINELPQL